MLELLIVLCLVGAVVQETVRAAMQEVVNPEAYAARKQRVRARTSVMLQCFCVVTILLLGFLFSF